LITGLENSLVAGLAPRPRGVVVGDRKSLPREARPPAASALAVFAELARPGRAAMRLSATWGAIRKRQGGKSCEIAQWRAVQDKIANSYVIEVAI
jgi:hypothetical protein